MPADFAGNNLNNSRNLNVNYINQNFRDWVGKSDKNDYYSFNLSNRSSLNLVVDGLSADANLQLLNSSGYVISASYNSKKKTESISANLDAGSYYIRVYRVNKKKSTYYNLKLSGNEAPQSLQLSTSKTTYQQSETVNLKNTSIFDGNGAGDLARVAFRLQKNGGEWQDIGDTVNFIANSNDNRYASFEYSLSGLGVGDYVLSAKAYDQSGASTDTIQNSFGIVPVSTQDWFDLNIQDAGIREAARQRFTDNVLDRNDMIAIFREAKDSSFVDSSELTDLRTLVNNSSLFRMPDYVRVLSNKVVNSDLANQSYQGSVLGSLYAGSSDIQLENLISKWFLGSDRPTSSYNYQYANGSLFQNGITYQDIKQGSINDCFFLTGLAATAFRSRSMIENMFIDNGDQTFTVRFYNYGIADYVTVDRYLPTNQEGYFVYGNKGNYYGNFDNELWLALAEKAYAQLNESGWIYQDNTNSYNGIGNGGYVSDALTNITGLNTSLANLLNFNSIVNAFNSRQMIGLSTKSAVIDANIIASHAYALVGYNSSTQIFTLFNPWGIDNGTSKPSIIELSWNQIEANFSYWDGTTNNIV
ncbi:MAG: pre-peptidase C-terminal domain-containing protein [Pelatocladus maniniholoensis HA4357-MV3]|uniref:Pre-peptidase C-terminal domain-containing protein n=1 Tax=Pelatocladus maniniholoensis HA4357-MV3 TaxID=1117104 RepID=A0A9E3H8E3_9NOST|nr:pre-peptidase C-terminal domain-containing protein [Pelatocladus maniniholoensis HA4357-MV3]